jgi:hypothetical protein
MTDANPPMTVRLIRQVFADALAKRIDADLIKQMRAPPKPEPYGFVLSPIEARRGIALGALPAELDPDCRDQQHIGGTCYIVQAEIPGWSP